MLTVTVQGCFASVQSQGVIAASQAQMMDASVLSYGLCFTHKSNPAYGIVNWGFTFQGLDMGIGHLRHVCRVKDDVPKNRINEAPNLIQTGRTAAQNR